MKALSKETGQWMDTKHSDLVDRTVMGDVFFSLSLFEVAMMFVPTTFRFVANCSPRDTLTQLK